jgi:hypothetical protein
MRVTMVGRRLGCIEPVIVILRRCCRTAPGKIMTVMIHMQMLPGFTSRQMVNRVAYARHARVSGIERKDKRQKEGENGSHLLVILSH